MVRMVLACRPTNSCPISIGGARIRGTTLESRSFPSDRDERPATAGLPRNKLIAHRYRSENFSTGALNMLQRFRQGFLVACVQVNVVNGILCLEAGGFADDKSDSLRLCLTDALRCLDTAFLHVEKAVSHFVG